jgi:hypothetical protein
MLKYMHMNTLPACACVHACRFAIRPEAFKAEGWLPQPPDSYLEALRRQQRLLHGSERRRCLHQHKVRAGKAIAQWMQGLCSLLC